MTEKPPPTPTLPRHEGQYTTLSTRVGPSKRARSEEDQPEAGGEDDGLSTALGAQLAQDGVDVELHGMLADAQPLSDGLIGQALGQELEHLHLARGQLLGQWHRASGSCRGYGGRQLGGPD